jgi:hypothetical protein
MDAEIRVIMLLLQITVETRAVPDRYEPFDPL